MSLNELIIAYLIVCFAVPWVFPRLFR